MLLTGCSPAAPLNLFAWRHGTEITRSIAYGDAPRQTLDVYRPASSTKSPVIVFFYGSSWQMGDEETYLFVAAALAQRGYVVVVPDYRVYPEVRYPAFLQDGARGALGQRQRGPLWRRSRPAFYHGPAPTSRRCWCWIAAGCKASD